MIEARRPDALGPNPDARGTGFAVYSSLAERVELCLFDAAGEASDRFDLVRGVEETQLDSLGQR